MFVQKAPLTVLYEAALTIAGFVQRAVRHADLFCGFSAGVINPACVDVDDRAAFQLRKPDIGVASSTFFGSFRLWFFQSVHGERLFARQLMPRPATLRLVSLAHFFACLCRMFLAGARRIASRTEIRNVVRFCESVYPVLFSEVRGFAVAFFENIEGKTIAVARSFVNKDFVYVGAVSDFGAMLQDANFRANTLSNVDKCRSRGSQAIYEGFHARSFYALRREKAITGTVSL